VPPFAGLDGEMVDPPADAVVTERHRPDHARGAACDEDQVVALRARRRYAAG
jgi:hypothetical protein